MTTEPRFVAIRWCDELAESTILRPRVALAVRQEGGSLTRGAHNPGLQSSVQAIPVARIRPEDGLGRKRDRDGHRELQRSIQQFGVLTPITVRPAPDESGEFLLIKGQGRTLACRLLGLETIPAVVVDDEYAEREKVQQFLVENVARLKMRPVDRALLIHRARQDGEETASIAARFGVSTTTVRRLLAQLDGASAGEVAALRDGGVTLATHAVVARHVRRSERQVILEILAQSPIKATDLAALFAALGWRHISALDSETSEPRFVLFAWACQVLGAAPKGSIRERLAYLAGQLPIAFERQGARYMLAVQ